MFPRHEIESNLKGETLVRKGLMHTKAGTATLRLVPDLNLVKIGGHGIIDYGRCTLHDEVGLGEFVEIPADGRNVFGPAGRGCHV